MKHSSVRWGLSGACAVGAMALTIAAPAANAAPAPCTAAGLSNTVSGVTADAGRYLDAHPDANDALTQAGSQSPDAAKASLHSYFLGHVDQLLQLQAIAQPLTSLRAQCNTTISAGQIAALLEALSG